MGDGLSPTLDVLFTLRVIFALKIRLVFVTLKIVTVLRLILPLLCFFNMFVIVFGLKLFLPVRARVIMTWWVAVWGVILLFSLQLFLISVLWVTVLAREWDWLFPVSTGLTLVEPTELTHIVSLEMRMLLICLHSRLFLAPILFLSLRHWVILLWAKLSLVMVRLIPASCRWLFASIILFTLWLMRAITVSIRYRDLDSSRLIAVIISMTTFQDFFAFQGCNCRLASRRSRWLSIVLSDLVVLIFRCVSVTVFI